MSESVSIRAAGMADVPAVLRLARSFLTSTAYGQILGVVDDDALGNVCRLVQEHGVIFLAEDDGGAVGFLAMLGVPHPFTGEGFADEIAWFVEPHARGNRRIGPLLLGAAEDWATRRELGMIKMVAPAGDETVGRYYRSRGYVQAETVFYKRL